MRLFGYYAWHTFVNQLKKLFKTWVMVFILICMLIGGIIGIGAAMLSDISQGESPDVSDDEVIEDTTEVPQDLPADRETFEVVELILGGILLLVFTMEAMGADKNGSRIFLPADVPLLFASPLKPQSVLLFRLMTQLGVSIMASVYLLFQVPNLVLNLGLGIWAVVAAIATWCLTLVMGKLIQIFLYVACSTHTKWKNYLRKGIYAVLFLIGGAYFAYWKSSGTGNLEAAIGFFNGGFSYYIPIWGWLKGFCIFAMQGNMAPALLCLGTILIGGTVLAYAIWHMKADFYEDAMAKSEETAELLAQAQSEKAGAVTVAKRKKDRSDRLKRDGMGHGAGANVFFYKSLYNRFRFAHLGVFTKTSETYLVTAVGVALLCRFVFKSDAFLPIVFVLGGFAFFRALGNPLEQDTQMDYFRMIPESTWSKLFWSLMGGTVNCLLDLVPAMVAAVILTGTNPLIALLWMLLIVSVDFFSTTVGTFISVSVPVAAGKMIKQFAQILFIYFGLLPDIAVVGFCTAMGNPAAGAAGAVAMNIGLGLLFFALTPLFMEPRDRKKVSAEKTTCPGDLRAASSQFSKLGMGAFMILLVGSALQMLVVLLWPKGLEHSWAIWLYTFAPLYLAAVPVGLLLIRRAPAKPLEKRSLNAKQYLVIFLISIFMMYAGNCAGLLVTSVLHAIMGVTAGNPIVGFATDSSVFLKILFIVILAPIIEEYIFRKQMIDRMHVYGEKVAIFTSALMFALFHGNLAQLFYAFTLGLVFGYVYLKTGKLRYSISLHMIINFTGSIVGPMFLEHLNFDIQTPDFAGLQPHLPWILGFVLYTLTILGMAIAGLILLSVNSRKIAFPQAEQELPKESLFKTVYLNLGMILLLAACFVMIIMSFT